MTAEIVALFAVVTGILLVAAYVGITGVPPTPTAPRVARLILDMLPSEPAGPVYDLGSGFGTLAIAIAGRARHRRVVGIERSPLPWAVSRLLAALVRRPNLTLRLGDYRRASLGDAAVVVCYLSPGAGPDLRATLDAELRPGAVVIANTFAIPGWTPAETRTADDLYRSRVYLYRV